MFVKVADGNGGRWLLKKKFATGWIVLSMTFVISILQGASVGEWGAVVVPLVGLILGADLADKKLNGGKYEDAGQAGGH